MTRFNRRSWIFLTTMALACSSAQAQSPTWPDRPVRVLVGFSPGGPTDIIARIASRHLSEDLKQPFVVDNRPGAAGNIATAAAAKAAPDGYTTLVASLNITINPAMMEGITFDSQKDIRPVRAIATAPTVLVVRPDFPARNYAEFVAELRRHPDRYNAAAQGSSPLLAAEQFSQLTQTRITPVTYQGAAPAMMDLMAGNVDLSFATLGSVLPQIKSGKIRAIAVATPTRSAQLPDVPTFAESGLQDFSFDSWAGVFVPARTPEPVIAALRASLDRLVVRPDYPGMLVDVGMTPVLDSDPAKLAAVIEKETVLYARLGKAVKERRTIQRP